MCAQYLSYFLHTGGHAHVSTPMMDMDAMDKNWTAILQPFYSSY